MKRKKPLILVHCATRENLIEACLGEPEYSYYFVLKAYLPVLRSLGEVRQIDHPATEVDSIYLSAAEQGRYCVFLDFCPPQLLELELKCPTVPVFAWEFENIPNEVWDNDLRQDWRYSLGRAGWAITHSSHTVANVRDHVRTGFPIISAPAPVWDQYSRLSSGRRGAKISDPVTLRVEKGYVVDTREIDLEAFGLQDSEDSVNRASKQVPCDLELNGVIYTSVLNPVDGRKNWMDQFWTFCWAFKDNPDATLVIKITHREPEEALGVLIYDLYKLAPFSCRVVAISGFLSDQDYEKLASCTTYAVNSSHGEGQCLPLMEYMSSGAPAIAPRHTGLLDYIEDTNTFVIETSLEPSHWPQDPRHYYRTMRHRLDWESMLNAYLESFSTVTDSPAEYEKMSRCAISSLQSHCSQRRVRDTLEEFLRRHEQELDWFNPRPEKPGWYRGLLGKS
jgi:glycosyltransferase involved in cell wall biosynthesis